MSTQQTIEKDKDGKKYIVLSCLHCEKDNEGKEDKDKKSEKILIYLDEINCTIYRHAYYIKNMKQIGPHTKKEECDRLVREKLVFGCAKPFKIVKKEGIYCIEICGYI
jgi:hypothetical protein